MSRVRAWKKNQSVPLYSTKQNRYSQGPINPVAYSGHMACMRWKETPICTKLQNLFCSLNSLLIIFNFSYFTILVNDQSRRISKNGPWRQTISGLAKLIDIQPWTRHWSVSCTSFSARSIIIYAFLLWFSANRTTFLFLTRDNTPRIWRHIL